MARYLIQRTPEEREEHIKFYIALPLKELRHRQDIITAQKRKAFELYTNDTRSEFKHIRYNAEKKWTPAFEEADEMDKDLFEAIDRKCFPVVIRV